MSTVVETRQPMAMCLMCVFHPMHLRHYYVITTSYRAISHKANNEQACLTNVLMATPNAWFPVTFTRQTRDRSSKTKLDPLTGVEQIYEYVVKLN